MSALSGAVYVTPNGTCLLEKGVYRSMPIALAGSPPSTGWEFSYNTCCRNSDQNSAGGGGGAMYLRSKMFPYTPPNGSSPLNANSGYDDSPNFLNGSALVATQGVHQINYQAYDADLDSLSFSFDQPFESGSFPSNFAPGYSFFFPFPDMSENPLNGPNIINNQSGIIQIETYNANTGFYKNCIKVQSFRNGQLIAEVYKELPLYIDGTTANLQNNPPAVVIDTALFPHVQRMGSAYRIAARNNDTIDLDLLVSDLDTNLGGQAQSFCLVASGMKINTMNPSSSTGCPAGGPCATITQQQGAGYCGSQTSVFNFRWLAQCQLLNTGLTGRTSYIFHIAVSDNATPVAKQSFISILVDLYPSHSSAPNLSITGGNAFGTVDFSWTASQAPAGIPFDGYVIYGNNAPGTMFSPIDTVFDRSQTSQSLTGLPFPAEFYVNQITGFCQEASENSDTISSLPLMNDEFSTAGFALYPQPAKGFFWLENQGGQKIETISLYSLQGNLIRSFSFDKQSRKQKLQVPTSRGVYLLQVQSEGQVLNKKLVLE